MAAAVVVVAAVAATAIGAKADGVVTTGRVAALWLGMVFVVFVVVAD